MERGIGGEFRAITIRDYLCVPISTVRAPPVEMMTEAHWGRSALGDVQLSSEMGRKRSRERSRKARGFGQAARVTVAAVVASKDLEASGTLDRTWTWACTMM